MYSHAMPVRRGEGRSGRPAVPFGRVLPTPAPASDRNGHSEGRARGKLSVGAVNDSAEAEADRIADRVLSAPGPAPTRPSSAAEPGRPASAETDAAVRNLGAGAPLPQSERQFFQPRFDRDLGDVRIHTGGPAHAASRSLGARAFTLGRDIAFANGEYRPGASAGRRLIAHELGHVVQGNGNTIRAKCDGNPADCTEEKKKIAEDHVTKSGKGSLYKKLVYKAAAKDKDKNGCYRPTDIAAWLKADDPSLFDGLLSHYISDAVEPLNEFTAASAGKIQIGDCFAFPHGWKDPNIGDINAELKRLNKKESVKLKNDIIATIYGEVSRKGPDLDLQRKYVLYSMLLRIKGPVEGPAFEDVVNAGDYHSKKKQPEGKRSTYRDNYLPALDYLNAQAEPAAKVEEVKDAGKAAKAVGTDKAKVDAPKDEGKAGKAAKVGKDKEKKAKKENPKIINKAEIEGTKKFIETVKEKDIPSDAGAYYFHWSEDTDTAENEYIRLLAPALKKPTGTKAEKDALKAAEAEAEKKAAFKHAKAKLGASMEGVTEKDGWLKKIPGPNGDQRMGSMYIYK